MKIAFCSCNHPLVHPDQPGWLAIAQERADVLLLLGDNIYLEDHFWNIFKPFAPALQLSESEFAQQLYARYAAQYAVPQFRMALEASAQVRGTLDDHDFLGNDRYVTPDLQIKARWARALHRQFIAACNLRPLPNAYPALNPIWQASDPGWQEGIGLAWSERFALADQTPVALICLDNRSFRQAPAKSFLPWSKPDPSVARQCLGEAQLNWLDQQLQGSQKVSIIASGSPLSNGPRWWVNGSVLQDYPLEAKRLQESYRKASVQQSLVHLGGDLHYNAHSAFDTQRGCTELVSSGMGSGWHPFAAGQRGNYGLIEIKDSKIRFQLNGAEPDCNWNHEMAFTH